MGVEEGEGEGAWRQRLLSEDEERTELEMIVFGRGGDAVSTNQEPWFADRVGSVWKRRPMSRRH